MTDFSHAMKGIGLGLFGFSLFAIGDVFAKFIGDTGYSPVQIGFWVSLFALIGFLSIAPEIGGLRETFKSKKIHLHVLRGIFSMGVFFCVMNGFKELGMALTYTLLFAGPFIAAILSVFVLKEHLGRHRIISILLGFIGVLIVLRPGTMPIDIAAIAVLIGAFCFASSSIIVRKIGNQDPIIAFAFYNSLISLICFGTINYFQGGFERLPTVPELTFFTSIMFFHIGGTFAVTRAFNQTETALVAPTHYIQLLWGVFFGYVLFEQTIDIWTAAGAGIIVLSGIYMIWREKVNHIIINRGVTPYGVVNWRAILRDQIRQRIERRKKER